MKDKVIFDDIEQFNKLWSDLTGCDALPSTIIKVKEKGYIRKSAVEVAEEMYSKVVEYKGCLKIDDYVKELEAEKAELLGILYKIRDSYCCETGFNLSDDVLNKYEGGE